MSGERFSRTEALAGDLSPLRKASVIVFGLGGVGGHCAETLARCGVGKITLCDGDVVDITNINRQIVALQSTLGRNKASVMAERIKDINPDCEVVTAEFFLESDNVKDFELSGYDYVADCIDDVSAKIALISEAKECGVPVISCMGAGNKFGTEYKVADISKTSVCPLARVMRRELKKRNITAVKAVYSEEEPVLKSRIPASIAFSTAAAGLKTAAEIIKDLLNKEQK